MDSSEVTTLNTNESTEVINLNDTEESNEEDTAIESEIDEVNVYVDRLKTFIDNGTESFGNAQEEVSDNELYAHKLIFTVNEEIYIIYYNVDELTNQINGIFIIGDLEYTIIASNSLDDKDDLDEDEENEAEENEAEENEAEEVDKVESDKENEESEQKMVLTATSGDNTIKITYKVEGDGKETKFYMDKNIDGEQSHTFLKITDEGNEYKIDIEEGTNKYTFKRESEEEGLVYKLNYNVDGVKGMVKIIETVNDSGEVIYEYKISEGNKQKHIKRQRPASNSNNQDNNDQEV